MTVSLNSVAISDTLAAKGAWTFHRQKTVKNGQGEKRGSGAQTATWKFAYLTLSEYQWLRAQLGGNPSITIPARLWDDQDTETDFTSVIMSFADPPYEKYQNGLLQGVIVEFDAMMPLLAW